MTDYNILYKKIEDKKNKNCFKKFNTFYDECFIVARNGYLTIAYNDEIFKHVKIKIYENGLNVIVTEEKGKDVFSWVYNEIKVFEEIVMDLYVEKNYKQ